MKFGVAHKLPLKGQFIAAAFFFSVAGLALAGAPLPVAAQSSAVVVQQEQCSAVGKGGSTPFTMDDVICGRVGTDKNQQSSVVEDEIMLRTGGGNEAQDPVRATDNTRTEPTKGETGFIVSDDLVE